MSRPGRITLGDFLRSSCHVGAGDDATRQNIAELLGFHWAPSASHSGPSPKPAVTPRSEQKQPAVEKREPPSEPADPLPAGENDAWLEPLAPQGNADGPGWYRHAVPLPLQPNESPEKAPTIDPLLEPRWTRALLQALLAVQGADENGPLDLPRVIERVARGEALERLPRLARPRLAGGVQVLVDAGPAMAPFAEDQLALLATLARFVPRALVQELAFESDPSFILRSDAWEPAEYQPPPAGTPVLVLSTLDAPFPQLGLGGVASTAAWLRVAGRAAETGCPLVALVPFQPARVSATLRRAMAVIAWDRTLTTGQIARTRRAIARHRATR